MSTTEFEQMSKTKGGLISFNNFLSTSQERDISLDFACGALSNQDMVGVLFVMSIDPSRSTALFASIADVGCYGDREKEVLFAMHTVFRIGEMTPMGGNQRLFQVELTLTSDNDKDLRVLTDRIQQETFPEEEGWYRLAKLLIAMGQSKKAEQVYRILLEQTTDASKRGYIYRFLGAAKNLQGEYEEAITFCEKSIEIYKKTLPSNHPDLGGSYNTIGVVYRKMGEYSKALSFYEKALAIRQQSLPPNHPDLAAFYGNIGGVYGSMYDYSKSLLSHEKALVIQQQSLPSNHPDLGSSYNNIGAVYFNMNDYSKARSCFERAVNIAQQSLPSNHPDLQKWKRNLNKVKKNSK
jgi:tetratricopeptide (TPR) repeat protein